MPPGPILTLVDPLEHCLSFAGSTRSIRNLDLVGSEGADAVETDLLGSVLDSETASIIGLPRARGDLEWHFCRAGLPYSLASELSHNADRTTLACYTERLIDSLDPRKKGWPERPIIPPCAHFERGLTSAERNPADKVVVATLRLGQPTGRESVGRSRTPRTPAALGSLGRSGILRTVRDIYRRLSKTP